MPKQNGGIEAFHANIAAMKKMGQDNAARRNEQAAKNTDDHLSVMNARAAEAAQRAEQRRLDGVARRNEHNARLKAEREARLAHDDQIKGMSLRAA